MLDVLDGMEEFRPDPAWSTALPDWEDRIVKGESLIPDLPLNEEYAARAVAIFSRLRVPDLIGQPTYGEVSAPWMLDLVAAIFGSYDPETRTRALREFFILVAKKNGKSAFAAAIIVTAAILNERPEAELILIAPTQHISGIVYKQARGIIHADETLSGLFHVKTHLKEIHHGNTGAVIKILSADGDVVTGSKAAYIVVDETHVLGAKAKAAEVFLELRGGLKSRPEGFLLQITTQSKDRPTGQFEKELTRAREVRDGKLALPLLPILYELPAKMQQSEAWRDPKTWGMVNPNLGLSKHAKDIADDLKKAVADGSEALALFASQELNVQVGLGLRTGRWVGADYWLGAARDGVDLDYILATSEVVVAGLDGGGLDDLLGLYILGRHAETKVWQGWGKAWADRDVLKLREKIAPELLELEAQGELTLVDNIEDEATPEIVAICTQVRDAGLFPEKGGIGMDPEAVGFIIDALAEAGFSITDIQAVSQGYKLNSAIKLVPVRLKNGRMIHGGQRIMTFCVGNARTEARGNAVIVTKAESGSAKIDPLMALFDAVMLMSWNPTAAGEAAITIPADYEVC